VATEVRARPLSVVGRRVHWEQEIYEAISVGDGGDPEVTLVAPDGSRDYVRLSVLKAAELADG